MRPDNEIVAMDHEVAHRGVGQVELQRLPVVAIVERNEYRALRTCEEQTFALGIFAHHIARAARRNALRDFRPRLAEVARPINMRTQVVKAKAVDGNVSGSGIEMRSLDDRDLAPGLELGRRNVLPGLSRILRDVN